MKAIELVEGTREREREEKEKGMGTGHGELCSI